MTTGHETGPALLGATLAELANRLRQRASAGGTAAPTAWANRLSAAARCWRRVGVESDQGGFGALAAGLDSLADALGAAPLPSPELPGRLHDLDAALGRLLSRYDTDGSGASLVADPAWSVVVAAFQSGEGDQRERDAAPAAAGGAVVALLVASPFLADVLRARLEAAGRRVLTLADPAAAPAMQEGSGRPAMFVGDNEEPTNHLRRLRELLGPEPFLVLVGPADGPEGHERRARVAGADAVWPEPWSPHGLPGPRGPRRTP